MRAKAAESKAERERRYATEEQNYEAFERNKSLEPTTKLLVVPLLQNSQHSQNSRSAPLLRHPQQSHNLRDVETVHDTEPQPPPETRVGTLLGRMLASEISNTIRKDIGLQRKDAYRNCTCDIEMVEAAKRNFNAGLLVKNGAERHCQMCRPGCVCKACTSNTKRQTETEIIDLT